MTLGFYDQNEGIAYPFAPPASDSVNGQPLSEVIVGGSFSLSTAAGFTGAQAVKLVQVEKTGFQKVTFTAEVDGLGVSFVFDAEYTGSEIARFTVVRALANDGAPAPELGSASLVISKLGPLTALPLSTPVAVDMPFEEGVIHLLGDSPVSSIRLANSRRDITLALHDDPIPAGTPTELLPSQLSDVSEVPVLTFCEDGYEVLSIGSEFVDVIVYEETQVLQDVDTFVEEAVLTLFSPPEAEDYNVVADVSGWAADGPYTEEIYTITITDAGTNTFSAVSNQGDPATPGVIVFDSFVAVGTKGLTVRWSSSLTPLANGMSWTIRCRRGIFAIPTLVTVLAPVVQQIEVPIYETSEAALTLEYLEITPNANPPVLVDVVDTDTYEDEDDTARLASSFDEVIEEVAVLTDGFTLREGYNLRIGVTASVPRIQLNMVPGAGRGLVPDDASVSDCNASLRSFFGAVPLDGEVEFQAGPGVIIVPERGAHRITIVVFDPTAAGVQSCD